MVCGESLERPQQGGSGAQHRLSQRSVATRRDCCCAYCGRPMVVKHPRGMPRGTYICGARYDHPARECAGGYPATAVGRLDADVWEKAIFLGPPMLLVLPWNGAKWKKTAGVGASQR